MTCYSFLTVHLLHQTHLMLGVNLVKTASFHFQGLPCSLESTVEKVIFSLHVLGLETPLGYAPMML